MTVDNPEAFTSESDISSLRGVIELDGERALHLLHDIAATTRRRFRPRYLRQQQVLRAVTRARSPALES